MRRVTIYDTRTRETRLFVPIAPPKVGLFVCGLTPYDRAHIGHGRFAVVFDVVARALRRWGYRPFYLQNVTNIDDRLIAKGGETGTDPLVLADRHFQEWRGSMERLGIRSVNYYPYATDYMAEIVDQIGTLVGKGFAYASEGSVYYDVAKFPDYGKLSGQVVDALRPGARVEVERGKKAPEDFVLWKAARPGEPSWPSPWGPGRPGWHIEDTAITVRLLGAQYDLHGGGLDLKFPHHEAEIAQAEAATGARPLVRFWMHSGLVVVGGEKMSKSIGNVSSLDGAIARFGPMTLRFYYLNAHYRSPLEFVDGKSLEEARESYRRLAGVAERLAERADAPEPEGERRPLSLVGESEPLVEALDATLATDFQTREAIAQLFTWARRIAEAVPDLEQLPAADAAALSAPFDWARETLGLFEEPPDRGDAGPLDAAVRIALAARQRARDRGDFAEADRIRAELSDGGIEVEDRGGTTRWRRSPPHDPP